jgi:hypothetical protein
MVFHNTNREPTAETVWLTPWTILLSERIASRDRWLSIIAKLG